MRRALTALATFLTVFAVSAPAYAYAHNAVTNPYLHAALDLLTLAVLLAPVWTLFIWARGRRIWPLVALIGLIQIPAAVLAFVPISDPVLHTLALLTSLSITVTSVIYVRREAAHEAAVEVVS